ncbi:MAG: radical SAM protein [Treponema sp.]|jgi:threonylcarbamoyladenosine tRNA methylthiotransferase MtaB|nr:radical SAM protein [Treponema sp.]
MRSFSIHTLGCKLNQVESEAVADAFLREGFELFTGEGEGPRTGSAGVFIINTCTVTSRSEQKARRLIRNCLRVPGNVPVIVTGCYARRDPGAIEALGVEEGGADRLFVISGSLKDRLLDLPGLLNAGAVSEGRDMVPLVGGWARSLDMSAKPDVFRFVPRRFSFHSRSFIKIQDGCGMGCTYCAVRAARGPGQSLEKERVLSVLRALEAAGQGEAVLTGVNISQYQDRGNTDLGGLLAFLLEGTRRIALRLSSLAPDSIDERLAEILTHPRIRPHFHLSIQSGSAEVLGRMGRPYGPGTVQKGLELLRTAKDDPFMACDIITGFPGEDRGEFEKTADFCRAADFAWIHAFPYSPRPGTAAFSWKGRAGERERGERAAILTEMAVKGRAAYAGRWTGREVEACIEGAGEKGQPESEKKSCCAAGLSDNYLKVLIRFPKGAAPSPGRALRCRLGPLPGDVPPGKGGFDVLAEYCGQVCYI